MKRFSPATLAVGALLVYGLLASLLILQEPGLQYDEALLVLGSVHMRHSPLELTLPHDPDTWACIRGRCFPLMTVRYVGALKEYFALPLFAIFGPGAAILRLLSMALGAVGIWGIARLVRDYASPVASAMVALVLAVNLAYVDMTVFDNGTVSIWMAAFGFLCMTISRYLRGQTVVSAFWVGLSMGLGVWARANFTWLLAALFVAVLLVLRTQLRLPARHWLAGIGGGILGGLPFLIYQVISRGGTWEAVGMFSSGAPVLERITTRLIMFSEVLLADREHRAMWDGPAMPEWQRWLFPLVVLAACWVRFVAGDKFGRVITLTFLFYGVALVLSPIQVAEHHLIGLVPLAAVVVVIAFSAMPRWLRWGTALVYFGSTLFWQIAAIQGLRSSGGVGVWSDAVLPLAEYLEQKYPSREVQILDWGLQNNLYVITDARLRTREIFWGATPRQSWEGTVRRGGVFVLNGPGNRQFPAATEGFLRTLAEVHPVARTIRIQQNDGATYAEIIEIEPTAKSP